jgi:quercetin dioxygenase-like cupin family protein
MKPISKWLVLGAVVGCLFVTWSARHVAAQQRTKVTVTHLFTGPDGLTHAEDIEVKMLPPAANAAANAGTENGENVKVTDVQFRRWAPGHENTWHTAPRRQYVITLSGRSEVELTGGKKILQVPGTVVLAEDVTGKGHITRSVGTEDWISVAVPLADK